ncbi:hypothetical protein [Bergeyella zoohelcum]|uniref:Uncharacterized protein n=1 Tax=Bergeyella zoohelcum TaxID=1015 RepID=A0A7Z8YS68_9FLAO|nr:hypothetical protein [Bergeyella zoohelcum]VDH05328.1 Uncharacterised protein [Bergeyella zoohelcum]
MNRNFKNIVFAVVCSFLAINTQAQNSETAEIQAVENPFTLNGIQQKIEKSLGEAFVTKNGLPLENLEKQLSENKENSQWNLYWKSYLNFYQTIFYLKTDNKEKASEYNQKSIDILQDKKNKNAEEYALLANNLSLSFVFMKNQMEAMQIDAKIRENLQKGFRLEKENPRLYYVEGNYDANIPKQYGGGKKAETSLLKAISLPEPNQNSEHLPTWGKREAYQSLLKWYSSENQKEKADELQKKFQSEFPEK